MNQTIVQKILAKNSGKKYVEPGEIISCKFDKIIMKEYTHGYYAYNALNDIVGIGNEGKFNAENIILASTGAFVPEVTRELHNWAKRIKIPLKNIYRFDGIFHYSALDNGHILPGMLYTCTDSHTPIGGALGAIGIGLGGTDVGALLAMNELWLEVPETIKVNLFGKLKEFVTIKDVMLKMASLYGLSWSLGKVVEFAGSLVQNLGMDGRYTLCNFSVDIASCLSAIIEPDEVTLNFLKNRTNNPINLIKNDINASYSEIIEKDVSNIEPLVACPHNQANVKLAKELNNVEVNQVIIGTCTNGRLDDLRLGARILKGRKINKNVRLTICPVSMEVFNEADKEGLISIFLKAGAVIANPSCLICNGRICSMPTDGEVVLTTANRNHRGRLGNPNASIYLSSPAVAAASAITGKITDPRDLEKYN